MQYQNFWNVSISKGGCRSLQKRKLELRVQGRHSYIGEFKLR
jgi:hypothetical protein